MQRLGDLLPGSFQQLEPAIRPESADGELAVRIERRQRRPHVAAMAEQAMHVRDLHDVAVVDARTGVALPVYDPRDESSESGFSKMSSLNRPDWVPTTGAAVRFMAAGSVP